jgi:recombinational DNA repair ATPase RecF
MFARVEIDGFKSFEAFVPDLNPLSVIVGPNAVGKSNFFVEALDEVEPGRRGRNEPKSGSWRRIARRKSRNFRKLSVKVGSS